MKRSLILTFILSLFSSSSWAIKAGQVVEIQGEVWRVRNNKKPILMKPNDWLHVGDELITGPIASAKVLMEDDTLFDVYEGSQLHIKSYQTLETYRTELNAKKAKDPKATLEPTQKKYRLSVGGVKGIFPKDKFKNKPVHIESPDSTIEISGTTVFAQVTAEKGEYSTSVLLTEGRAYIKPTLSNQFKRQAIPKGQLFATDYASKLGHSLKITKLNPSELKNFSTRRGKEAQKYRKSLLSGKRKFVLSPELKKFYRQNRSASAREKNHSKKQVRKLVRQNSNKALAFMKQKKKNKFKKINNLPKCTTKPVCQNYQQVRVRNAQGNFVWVNKCAKFEIKRFPVGCRP